MTWEVVQIWLKKENDLCGSRCGYVMACDVKISIHILTTVNAWKQVCDFCIGVCVIASGHTKSILLKVTGHSS